MHSFSSRVTAAIFILSSKFFVLCCCVSHSLYVVCIVLSLFVCAIKVHTFYKTLSEVFLLSTESYSNNPWCNSDFVLCLCDWCIFISGIHMVRRGQALQLSILLASTAVVSLLVSVVIRLVSWYSSWCVVVDVVKNNSMYSKR